MTIPHTISRRKSGSAKTATGTEPERFESRYVVDDDGRELLTVVGGAIGGSRFIEIRNTDETPAVRAEWNDGGIASYLRGDTPGTPVTVSVGDKPRTVMCRNGRLYSATTGRPWRLPTITVAPEILSDPAVFTPPITPGSASGTRIWNAADWWELAAVTGGGAAGGAIAGAVWFGGLSGGAATGAGAIGGAIIGGGTAAGTVIGYKLRESRGKGARDLPATSDGNPALAAYLDPMRPTPLATDVADGVDSLAGGSGTRLMARPRNARRQRTGFDLRVDGREVLALVSGADDQLTYLEIRDVDASPLLRAEWAVDGVDGFLRGRAMGIPMTVVVSGGEEAAVLCRDGSFYDRATNKPWRPPARLLERPIFKHPLVFPRPLVAVVGSDGKGSRGTEAEAAGYLRSAGGYEAVAAGLFGAFGYAATKDRAGTLAGTSFGSAAGAAFGAAAFMAGSLRR